MLFAQTPHWTRAQESQQSKESKEGHIGLPIDWSSRHVIFTNGGSPDVVAKTSRDPRSWINWVYRTSWAFPHEPWQPFPIPQPDPLVRHQMRIDWAMPLGKNAGMPLAESPAKYSFNITGTPSCANDFVVYTIAATPGAGQANIVAFNNLYTGTISSSCPTANQSPPNGDLTQPTFMWAYAAGSGGSALSPTLSLNGQKVAFIESGTQSSLANPAYFDVLTWTAGQGTSATTPKVISAGSSLSRLNYTNSGVSGCGTGTSNSNSSPYIDYTNDAAYIGADNGMLYRISPVFNGTPAVQFCVTVNAGHLLTSPVYDSYTNQVFVSDGFSLYSYTVNSSSFTLTASTTVSSTSAANKDPLILSPIVDSTNGFVYVFASADTTNTYSIVAQFNTSLTSSSIVDIGPAGGNAMYIFDGDFDNAYFASGPTTGAGTLYACGTQTGSNNAPALYALGFTSGTGAMTSTSMADNTNINNGSNGYCSPLMDFFDGTNDRLFVGVGSLGSTGGANLVTEWSTNSRIASTTTPPTNSATNEWGGTSAFSIDNVSTEDQAASIYFGTLAPAASGASPACPKGQYCAIKLTQSQLQ